MTRAELKAQAQAATRKVAALLSAAQESEGFVDMNSDEIRAAQIEASHAWMAAGNKSEARKWAWAAEQTGQVK